MHHAIVYSPNLQLEKINAFRKQYDPMFHIIPPHITLVFPFLGIPEEQIIQHLETVKKNIKPFKIHLNGLMKSFDNYLFLLVKEGKEEIQRVHDLLYSGILASQLQTDIPFIPHITLGLFRAKDNQFENELYDNACTEAQKLNLDITCEFNSLSLIKGDGVKPRKIIRTFDIARE